MAAEAAAYVLDSFALLAYLGGEPGMARVQELLAGAKRGAHTIYLSFINLGEALYITERENDLVEAQKVLAAVEQLPLHLVHATRAVVLAAAHVKARHPVSYADSFAVATAQEHGGVIVTGDPEFKAVEDLVRVDWLPH